MNIRKPICILAAGLLTTIALSYMIETAWQEKQVERFRRHVSLTHMAISEQLESHMALLRATLGFFAGSDDVRLGEFRAYAQQIGLEEHYPGLQGIGFTLRIPENGTAAVESRMIREGYEQFHIWPEYQGEQHAIVYLEPLEGRNREALGFNMFSDPVRREAMEKARDTGLAASTPKVTLLQETDHDVQAGFLIYLPVYRAETPDTLEERRSALVGFVYSPLRSGDFLRSVLDRANPWVNLAVYETTESSSPVFQSPGFFDREGPFRSVRTLHLADQTWAVVYRPAPQLKEDFGRPLWILTFLAGALISVIFALWTAIEARNERRLQESEGRLQRIIDHMVAFVGEIDLEGNLKSVNKPSLKAGGLEPADVLGKKIWDCYWWNYDPHVAERLKNAVATALTGEVVSYDETVRVAHDRRMTVHFQLSPVRDTTTGELVCIIPSGVDISDRVTAEESLRKSEERFRGTFENAAVGISHVALDGRFLRTNDRFCAIVGYTRDELKEKTFQSLIHPDDLQIDLEQLGKLGTGVIESYRLEKRHVRKDGEIIWVTITCSLGKAIGTEGAYAIAVVEDISGRKSLELELSIENERKNRFLATLSHELRNPLAPVSNALSVLGTPGLPQDKKDEILQIGLKSVDHLVRLVNDLLDITRITRGKIELQLRPVNLVEIIDAAIDEVRPRISEKGHYLSIEGQDLDLEVLADTARLRQIFSNILHNATKFTPRDGQITVVCSESDGMAIVTICDTGPGVPEEMLEEIFGIFTQLRDPLERSEGGLGIGLSLVRELVSMHGGYVTAANRKDRQGAEFTIALPLLNKEKKTGSDA